MSVLQQKIRVTKRVNTFFFQDAENSIRSHQIDVQRVITLGKRVITELKIGEMSYIHRSADLLLRERVWVELSIHEVA